MLFQSPTGVSGHLATGDFVGGFLDMRVSIPNGRLRPFSLCSMDMAHHRFHCFNPQRASQAI